MTGAGSSTVSLLPSATPDPRTFALPNSKLEESVYTTPRSFALSNSDLEESVHSIRVTKISHNLPWSSVLFHRKPGVFPSRSLLGFGCVPVRRNHGVSFGPAARTIAPVDIDSIHRKRGVCPRLPSDHPTQSGWTSPRARGHRCSRFSPETRCVRLGPCVHHRGDLSARWVTTINQQIHAHPAECWLI